MFASVVPANVVYGRRLPNAVRGSAFGIINGVVMAANAIGALVGGAIAATAGTRTAVIGAASVACAIGLATLLTLPSLRAEPAIPGLATEGAPLGEPQP
jgi:predicted MFS family arabinose efflux permease